MPLSRRSLLLTSAAALAGCSFNADQNHDSPDAPRAEPLRRPVRVAWVLSSGGPRGFVHVGVLQALEELQLQPDLIVGASVGALVGCLRASGMRATDIAQLALDLQPWTLGRVALGVPERLSGSAVAALVREHARVPMLEDMPVAMACVAQRSSDGAPVAFTAGDAGLAVQASAAIEGWFAPVRIRGQHYVDPDWSAPLPVRVARALGARRVLAIDATAHLDRAPPRRRALPRERPAQEGAGRRRRRAGRPGAQARFRLLGQPLARVPRAGHGRGLPGDDGTGGGLAGAACRLTVGFCPLLPEIAEV